MKPEQLASTHPDYSGVFGTRWWKLLRDAYEGAGGFRTSTVLAGTHNQFGDEDYEGRVLPTIVGDSYLVRYPRERLASYYRRQCIASFPNFVRPVLSEYNGLLWKRPPQRFSESPSVQRFYASTPMDAWMQDGTRGAQLFGWRACLVDRPETFTPGTVPTTVARWLEPEEVMDWELDANGDFEWVKLGTTFSTRDRFTGECTSTGVTYTIWDANTWQRVVVTTPAGEEPVVEVYPPVPHPVGRVPVEILYWGRPIKPHSLYGISHVDGVTSTNLDLFNVLSEQREFERSQVFGILCIQSANPDVLTKIKLGTNNGLVVEPGMGFPQFVSPNPSVGDHYAKRVEALISRIYEEANLERPAGSPSTSPSGIAQAWRFQSTRAMLVQASHNLTAFELGVADLVARWAGEGDPRTKVTYPVDFDVDDLSSSLTNQFLALEKANLLKSPEVSRHARTVIGRTLNPGQTPEEEARMVAEVEAAYEAESAPVTAGASGTPKEPVTAGAVPPVKVTVVEQEEPEEPEDDEVEPGTAGANGEPRPDLAGLAAREAT